MDKVVHFEIPFDDKSSSRQGRNVTMFRHGERRRNAGEKSD